MKRLFEFFFSRWKKEVIETGTDTYFLRSKITGMQIPNSDFLREWVKYKYTNKFDGSEKIKKVYLN